MWILHWIDAKYTSYPISQIVTQQNLINVKKCEYTKILRLFVKIYFVWVKQNSNTFYMSKCKEKVRKQVSWKKMYSFNNISIHFIGEKKSPIQNNILWIINFYKECDKKISTEYRARRNGVFVRSRRTYVRNKKYWQKWGLK